MRAVEKYLKQHPLALIDTPPNVKLGIIVTIPAFNEAEAIKSLESLLACTKTETAIEIIVNVNFSEEVADESKHFNKVSYRILKQFAKQNSNEQFKIHVLYFPNQDAKKAGVGWARKQIMDEAFRRLLSVNNENGIITGFDADSTCRTNYFIELEKFFNEKPKAKACSIKFEHKIEGEKYSANIYHAIALYELHLRYFINAQKLTGTPYAFQTVGSSFAVRAVYYAQVNGMSPKKAGEDFYFLQKIIALGEFYQLNTSCVYPSSRISNRVGFGTGPSVGEISKTGEKLSYNLKSFLELKKLYDQLPSIYENKIDIEDLPLDALFISYLKKQNAKQVVQNLRRNNKDFTKFRMAFLQWFGGFQILKVLNILASSEAYKYTDIIESVNQLKIIKESNNVFELLKQIRILDASEDYSGSSSSSSL